jgi:hypothetical protein
LGLGRAKTICFERQRFVGARRGCVHRPSLCSRRLPARSIAGATCRSISATRRRPKLGTAGRSVQLGRASALTIPQPVLTRQARAEGGRGRVVRPAVLRKHCIASPTGGVHRRSSVDRLGKIRWGVVQALRFDCFDLPTFLAAIYGQRRIKA